MALLLLLACTSTNNSPSNQLDRHQVFTPYIGPYLSLLSPTIIDNKQTPTVLNPATNMIINYELKNLPATFIAKVFYRKAGDEKWLIQKEDNIHHAGNGWQNQNDINWGKVHHITLKHLSPKTKYEYRVLGLNGAISKQFHFITTDVNNNASRFLVIGDMQDEQTGQRWQEIADTISENHMDEFDFIIGVGDLAKDDVSEAGDRFYWWKLYFNKGQNLLAYKPMLPSLGNHDTPASTAARSNKDCSKEDTAYFKAYCSNADDSRSFRKYFNIHPDNLYPNYFSFKQGNACFISANTEIPIFYGRYPELDTANAELKHHQWLKRTIKQHKSCTWSIVYQHIPVINASSNKEYEIKFIRHYAELYNQSIDWSITGHTHQYQRMHPLNVASDLRKRQKTYGRQKAQGVGYMIVPPAGQWPRNDSIDKLNIVSVFPHNDLDEAAYEIGFTIIKTQDNSISFSIYGMGSVGDQVQPDGYRANNDRSVKLLDSFAYSKD